jgi:LacI family transcriptional regulator
MSSKGKVSIVTIGESLGLSFSTVSKALNDDPRIKKSTKERVLAKAAELGYTPNAMAKNLRQNKTNTISVIFNDLENPILTSIFGTISNKMAPDYITTISDSRFDPELEKAHILNALANRSDIILIEPTIKDDKNLLLLKNHTGKVIVFGVAHDEISCSSVIIDYKFGGYISAKEMLDKGHTKCAVFGTQLYFPPFTEFIKGISQAYTEAGIDFDSSLVYGMNSSSEEAFQQTCQLFERSVNERPTGIITFCDILALGVFKAAKLYNFNIPNDISVIGHDDYPLSEYTKPELTTIHLPKKKIAKNCINIIKNILNENKSTIQVFSSEPVLMRRESISNLRLTKVE